MLCNSVCGLCGLKPGSSTETLGPFFFFLAFSGEERAKKREELERLDESGEAV